MAAEETPPGQPAETPAQPEKRGISFKSPMVSGTQKPGVAPICAPSPALLAPAPAAASPRRSAPAPADAVLAWAAVGGDAERSGSIQLKQLHAFFNELGFPCRLADRAEGSPLAPRPSRRMSSALPPPEEPDRAVGWEEFAALFRVSEHYSSEHGLGPSADELTGASPAEPLRDWVISPRARNEATLRALSGSGSRAGAEGSAVLRKKRREQQQQQQQQPEQENDGESPTQRSGQASPPGAVHEAFMEQLRVSAMRGKGRHRHIHPGEILSSAERAKAAAERTRAHEELMSMFSREALRALSARTAARAQRRRTLAADPRRFSWAGPHAQSAAPSHGAVECSAVQTPADGPAAPPSAMLSFCSSPVSLWHGPGMSALHFLTHKPRKTRPPRPVRHRQLPAPQRYPTPGAAVATAQAEYGDPLHRVESLPDPYPELRSVLGERSRAIRAGVIEREGTHAPSLGELHSSMAGVYRNSLPRPVRSASVSGAGRVRQMREHSALEAGRRLLREALPAPSTLLRPRLPPARPVRRAGCGPLALAPAAASGRRGHARTDSSSPRSASPPPRAASAPPPPQPAPDASAPPDPSAEWVLCPG